jgi:type I restriction enzyme S subunit
MCKSGATTGKVAFVDVEDEFSVWSPLALIRADRRRVVPRLLWWVLQDQYVQRQVQETWSYGTQPNLSMAAMERLLVVLPPVEEQTALVNHLEQTASRIVTAMDRAESEIDLMREFRTRLIADVVTGRLDVREVAAHLSDEVVEPAPLDDVDALVEGDGLENEADLDGPAEEAEA